MLFSRVGLTTLAACCLTACLGTSPERGEEPGDGPDPRDSSVGHIVISVADIVSPPSLVTLIGNRITNVQIQRRGGCPEIEFRGRNSIFLPTPASVYVDGQHALDTCVLDMLNPHDVDWIEVYPMGVSNRPGYFTNSGGLILVFSKMGK